MASDGEDNDLDALRSAVLASLKTRVRNGSSSCVTTEDEGSRHDVELEELRKAALQSKKLIDDEDALQTNFRQAGFPTLSRFGRRVGFLKGFNRNANLIVIEPVDELSVESSNSLPHLQSQTSFQSLQPQRSKGSGKFSRFDSDSNSDSSEDNSDYSNEKSQSSNLTDEDANSNHSNIGDRTTDDCSQNASDEEAVLQLNDPDDDLNLNDHDEDGKSSLFDNPELAGKCTNSEVVKQKECTKFKDKHRSAKSSIKTTVRSSLVDQLSSEIEERRDRYKRENRYKHEYRLAKFGDNLERRRKNLKNEKEGRDRRGSRRHVDDRKGERRSKSVNDKIRRKDKPQRSTKDVPLSSVVISELRSLKESKSTPHSPSRNEHKTVLRSRNSSPNMAARIDLREKLRQKQQQSSSDFEGDVDDRSNPVVIRSVLNIVTSTVLKSSSADELKSKSRSPMRNSAERRARTQRAARRKSESPGRLGASSPKTRKVLIISEEATIHNSRKDGSGHGAVLEGEEGRDLSPIQRVPVRQRLGVPPKTPTKSSSSVSFRRSKQTSISKSTSSTSRVKHIVMADNVSDSSEIALNGDGAKRKVKLRRGTYEELVVDNPSTSVKLEQEMKRSGRHKGLPTFENELDERIRRIQANNEAILKRKYEIAWDRHRHK